MKRHHSLHLAALTVLIALVLTLGAPGQSNAEILGNLPPEGAMIAEVSTTTESYDQPLMWLPGDLGLIIAELPEIFLPLPHFSTGEVAEPDECMWIVGNLDWELDFSEPLPFTITSQYLVEDGLLSLYFYIEGNSYLTYGGVSFDVTVVAIRTSGPVPRESVSFGEIKAMYRN